jgi:amino acid transporter
MTTIVERTLGSHAAEGDADPVPASGDGEHRLAANSVSLLGVLFVAIAVMAPGTGAAYAIVTGAAFAGGGLTLAVVIALIGSALVAVAIGQLAKHMSSAGGLASYVGASLHRGLAFVVAFVYPFVYLFAMPYLGLVFGNLIATSIVPEATGTAYHVIWMVGALSCLAMAFAMNYFGVKTGARIGLVLGISEIVVFLVISVWMIIAAGDANTVSVFTTKHATVPGFEGTSGIVAASVFGFLAFIGFEAAAPLAEETKNPKRNVPRAVVGSALLVGLFYVLTTYAASVYFGPGNMGDFLSFNGGNGWIGMAKSLWGAGWVVLLIVLLNSTLACTNGAALAATRSIWAMGRSGTLPRQLGRTHARWRSPVNAILIFFGVGVVLTYVGGVIWDPVTAYSLYGTVLTIAVLPIYFLAAIACPVYYFRFRRNELNVLLHVIIPLLGAAFLVPAFCAGAGIQLFSFVSAPPWPISLAGPIVGVWYAIGLVGMAYLLIRRPSTLESLSQSVDVPAPAEDVSVPVLGTPQLADA